MVSKGSDGVTALQEATAALSFLTDEIQEGQPLQQPLHSSQAPRKFSAASTAVEIEGGCRFSIPSGMTGNSAEAPPGCTTHICKLT